MRLSLRRSAIAALAAAALALPVLPAEAHHGWSWTESGFIELRGIVRAVYIGNPHATLDVDVEGVLWRVELAPPSATLAAGFDETVAKEGDEIVAIGNRSSDSDETRMKAVRVIVGGETYDVYPDRAKSI